MNKCSVQFAAILLVLAPGGRAQVSGAVQIYTVPSGIAYTVDGEFYRTRSTAIWPTGSKHVLSLNPVQVALNAKTRYAFGAWQYTGGSLPGATVTVTADPAIKEFFANFDVQHAVSLNYSACTPDIPCPSPGTIFVNGAPYTNDADVYVPAGSVAKLVASPASGYVFTGWDPGFNQSITGFVNDVLVAMPIVVRPRFQLARRIDFETVPAELELFADRARVPTPSTLEWGYGTVHTVGAPSPQIAKNGSQWVFSKWSDGAAENHAYTVPDGGGQVTLTATFVPGTGADFRTSPPGLLLKIDGRDNWPGYSFTWPAGEIHRIEAPEQQIDESGRLWSFSSWSNGGARVQDYIAAQGPTGGVRVVATYTPVGRLVVNSAVAGLIVKIDGAECAIPCDVRRPIGTAVRVTAPASIPAGEHTRVDFDGWPGSGSTAADWSVTLSGEPLTPYLTYHKMNRLIASSDPVEAASWRMQPVSPDGFFDARTTVIVNVRAQAGFRFRGWSGDASGGAAVTSVMMNTPRSVEALFDRVPYVAPAGVANAAGSTSEKGVAPGSIVSIFGASFAPDLTVGPESPLKQTLGGVTVKTSDRILPLFFVSPSQINLQLPEDMALGDQHLTVSCLGLPEVQTTFTTVRNAPGLFQSEQSFAVGVHQDGSPITVDSPAKSGELVTVFGTGFGPTERARTFGFSAPAASPIVDTATVLVDEVAVAAASAFAVAGRIGVDAVQFRIREGASGKLSVRVTVNGKDSNTVLMAVE